MKKLLCVLSLLLALTVSVTVCADSSYDQDVIDTLISLVEMSFDENDFKEVTYNEYLNAICIKHGIDGFADSVESMIKKGYDASYQLWEDYKEGTLDFYESTRNFCSLSGFEDLGVVFAVVNDNVYMDSKVKGMPSPYLLIIMDGEICFDIIGELNGY